MEHLVEAGLKPLEALRMATEEEATAVDAEDDHLGKLAAGKLADIVLLDAAPLESIRNTQAVWRVVKERSGPHLPEKIAESLMKNKNPFEEFGI